MINVIINEQHSILPQQAELIKESFGDYAIISIPAKGLSLLAIKKLGKNLKHSKTPVLFISPIPALIKQLNGTKWFVLHNDKRDKKELPDGRIVFTPAKDGWKIV